ncbi:MAG: branched-chain amino acid ABC transporter permease [Desulfuromonadaceae bacterium]|nr:branched-chain amino acid ABC transporter permease [Desulfuromonadaceae bacterium]MDD5107762.1 branched-chain amino acid ABC transporter permease [Desulfuromonadaceae bacterium]
MNKILWIILIVLGLVAPFIVYPVFMMKLLCFALFASAFNLLLGYTGLLSFGHAAFFGGASYITGQLVKISGLTPELGILGGTLFAALLGYIVGSLAIRRQGIYFAMVTLALAQIVYFIALKAPFTGGEDGLQGIPRGKLLGMIDLGHVYTVGGSPVALNLYYFVFALFCFGFWIIYRTINSPFGQVLKAIRENEPRAVSLGYKVERFKLMAFVISAALSGMAGSMKSLVFQLASLTDVSWHTSGEVVLMTLLGGVGTVLGPLAGAFTVVTLQSELSSVGSWITVIIGVTFVICVLLFRRGLVGELGRVLKRSL